MRITVTISDKSLEELLTITHAKKKSKAITKAVESFLREQKLALLLSLRGKLKLNDNLKDIKALELKKLASLSRIG